MNFEGRYFLSSGVLYLMAKRAYEQTKCAPSDTARKQDDALTAVLFSAATLEAFIAELAHYAESGIRLSPTRSPPVEALAGVLNEIESSRGSVKLKYLMAKAILSGQAYDKGSNPYQDFALLFDIRNAILHYKPEKITQDPHKIVAALADRGLCQREEANRKASWLGWIKTRAVARWACNVVRDMIGSIRDDFPKDTEKTATPFMVMAFASEGFDGVE